MATFITKHYKQGKDGSSEGWQMSFPHILLITQRKEKDREDIASQLGRQKYVLILRQLNQSQCPHFTAQPLLRTLKYTLADEEGTLHSWRKAFIEMNLHFGRNSLIIAMLIGLISTWYGHNVALRVRSISSFSMVGVIVMIKIFSIQLHVENQSLYMI